MRDIWPLTRKRSLRFAVFARISVCIPCISRAHELAIRAIGSGYPCEKKFHLFARLRLSVRKKLLSVRTALAIHVKKNYRLCAQLGLFVRKKLGPCARLGLSVRKKIPSIRTASAIRAKNIVMCPTAWAIPSKQLRISNELFATWSFGQESCNKPVKNLNNFIQALC